MGRTSASWTVSAGPFRWMYSITTRELVDAEVRRILSECYEQAVGTQRANRDRLDRLARALLDHEALDADQAYAAAGIPREAADAPRPDPSPPVPRAGPGTCRQRTAGDRLTRGAFASSCRVLKGARHGDRLRRLQLSLLIPGQPPGQRPA